jgi:nucleotide sugar dehydrogenase
VRVAIIGTGYVGLISAVTFTKDGHQVYAVDYSLDVVSQLSQGIPHFYEPKLEERLQRALKSGLQITNSLPDEDFDVYMLTVGTPTVDGEQDLSQIINATKMVISHHADRENFAAIVVKSTVVPGTTEMLETLVLKRISSRRFGMCMNPEFLREGSAIDDAENPDRIVIGCSSTRALEIINELYENAISKKFIVPIKTAEIVKYINNALLACLISFSNEMSNIAGELGEQYSKILEILLSDKRWIFQESDTLNPSVVSYLRPGPGYGGSCFPKDVAAIAKFAEKQNVNTPILRAIEEVNRNQPAKVLEPLVNKIKKEKALKILVLGLSFKENTSDVRGTVAAPIVRELLELGAEVKIHDPISAQLFCNEYSIDSNLIVKDWIQNLEWSDAVVLLTAWDDYKILEGEIHYSGFILDPRNILRR